RAVRVRVAKPAVLSLSTTPAAENSFSRSRRASFSERCQSGRSRSSTRDRSVSNVVSALIDLVSRPGSTRRASSARASAQRRAVLAQAAQRLAVGQRLQVGELRDAALRQAPCQGRAYAGQQAHRLGGE